MRKNKNILKKGMILAAVSTIVVTMAPAIPAYAYGEADSKTGQAAFNAATTGSADYQSWLTGTWQGGTQDFDNTNQIALTPGSTAKDLGFAWYSKTTDTVSLTYGLQADLSDGKTVQIATKITGQKDKDGNEYNSNKATISGLAAQTTYYYKVDDKEIKSFKTGNTGKFRFAFVGDPQIGSSNELKGYDTEAFYNAQSNAVANDSYNWSQTLKKIQSAGTDFIVSAGDQIQTTKKKAPGQSSTTSEIEYAGYLSPDALTSLPVIMMRIMPTISTIFMFQTSTIWEIMIQLVVIIILHMVMCFL